MPFDYSGLLYAVLAGSEGCYSFMKSGRLSALSTGIIMSCTLGVGALKVSSNNSCDLSLVSSATLGSLMGYQYYKSRKIMPAGLLAVISIAMTLRYASMLTQKNDES